MLYQVELDYLQFFEVGCQGRQSKTEAFFWTVEATFVNTGEQSCPFPQEYTARRRYLVCDEVVVEILDQQRPGQHSQKEVLIDPNFHETIDRGVLNYSHELLEIFQEDTFCSCFKE